MASLGLPGLAGFWGEFPAILVGLQPGARASTRPCSARTWSSPPSARSSPPATCCGCSSGSPSARPTEEFDDEHIHDVHLTECIAWAPLLVLIVVLGVYPNLMFDMTDEAVTQSLAHRPGPVDVLAAIGRQRRGRVQRADARLARARARGRSSPPRSWWSCWSTCSPPDHDKWLTSAVAGLGLLGRARAGPHPGRRRRRPGRCSAAPTSSTTSRWC